MQTTDAYPDRGGVRANILIVDDRPDKLLVFQAVLEELRQNIYTAASGEQALREVLKRDFAVILLDVNMPAMDGLETASLIRRRSKSAHTPIIFITADYNDEPHTAQGYSLGAVDYIASPVVPEVLRAKVKVFVELYLLAQRAKRQSQEHIVLAEERAARASAEQATRRLTFLAEASARLGSSLDFAATTSALARIMVPAFADISALSLNGRDGEAARTEIAWCSDDADAEPRTACVEHLDQAAVRLALARVAETGKAERWSAAATGGGLGSAAGAGRSQPVELAPGVWVESTLIVPLVARGHSVGALLLGMGVSRRSFDADALAMAIDLGSRAAIALDNALLYRKIQEEDRRKNEFLAMLGHELRNPLAPISNAVHVLNGDAHDAATVSWARDVIGRQHKQLVRLVDDLLDVSRITRGKIELKIETVDLSQVIAAAVETSRPHVDAHGHTLTILLPPEPLALRGDFARVAQILSNLINNAAKYTERGGRISVTARREGGEIVFRVRDSGVGIAKEFLATIFEPFTQVDRTLDRSQGGLGIGLTLVRRLVEMQDGSVSASSEGRNCGSEFVVRLPAAEVERQASASASDSLSPSRLTPEGVSVLVVDDNHDVADTTALVLRTMGCQAQVAYDGMRALEYLASNRPDAVLLDIGLPGMDGYEVAEAIRSTPNGNAILIVAVSGYGQDDGRATPSHPAFDYHIVKPIDPRTLSDLLSSLRSPGQNPVGENVVRFRVRKAAG